MRKNRDEFFQLPLLPQINGDDGTESLVCIKMDFATSFTDPCEAKTEDFGTR